MLGIPWLRSLRRVSALLSRCWGLSGEREEGKNENHSLKARVEKCLGKKCPRQERQKYNSARDRLSQQPFSGRQAQNGKSTVLNPSKIVNKVSRSRQGKIQSAYQSSPISHPDNIRDKRYMYRIHKCRTDRLVTRVPVYATRIAKIFAAQKPKHRLRYIHQPRPGECNTARINFTIHPQRSKIAPFMSTYSSA